MNSENPLDRQAFTDKELAPNKASELQASLSPDEKVELKQQAQFNLVLGNQIKQNQIECPDHLWNNLKNQFKEEKKSSQQTIKEIPTFYSYLPTIIKIAAVVIAGIFLFGNWNIKKNPKSNSTAINNSFVPKHLGGFDEVQNMLNTKGLHVNIGYRDQPGHHDIKMIGMDWVNLPKAPTKARLLFMCCDTPVIVYIEASTSSQIKTPQQNHINLRHHIKKNLKDYLIKAHSDHHPSDVLDIIY